MNFQVGQTVRFAGATAVVREKGLRGGRVAYLVASGDVGLPMWVPSDILAAHQSNGSSSQYRSRTPSVIIVDDFFVDPDEVRDLALAQEYHADLRYFKGLRSTQRFLWPHLREEFARLLGTAVTEWLGHNANGCFQQTNADDPLVWHHDTQSYAAAVYLTPDAPPSGGTSFWRDRTSGSRRAPTHPLEQARLGSQEAVESAKRSVYDEHNIVNPDNWELVESVAGLYNRLVIWDASLIHSATSYESFEKDAPAPTRLVQLFFFDA